MESRKILFFSDLEGTILRETDGSFEDKDFYELIAELSKLGKILNSAVEIRLISPIGFKRMNSIIERMDNIIFRHAQLTSERNVKLVEAVASPYDVENDLFYKRVSNKITSLPKVLHGSDIAQEQKRKYVTLVMNSEKDEDVAMYIYAGNGRNDIEAMKSLKNRKKGFIVCPQNSRTVIRKMASFCSEKTDLQGIIDGIHKIKEKATEKINGKTEYSDFTNGEKIRREYE